MLTFTNQPVGQLFDRLSPTFSFPLAMTHPLFTKHEDTLAKGARRHRNARLLEPVRRDAQSESVRGNSEFRRRGGVQSSPQQTFEMDQPATGETVGAEVSPFGFPLGIRYPKADPDALLAAAAVAQASWRAAGPKAWVGVSLEILARVNRASFEIGYSVMHTTGQAFMMAFQAGGPHAQDRALEAVVYAWDQLRRIPADAYWEKPQGKNPPLAMHKRYTVVPRGTGLVLGCCTFPTWNGYPGLFADLATGNTVVVKPHPGAILPLALTVRIARDVLREAGFDPNVVTLLATEPERRRARAGSRVAS
jgi:phenylacetic acid degradation protein paaN